eukprot:6910205-Prymnesium_polylepis.2
MNVVTHRGLKASSGHSCARLERDGNIGPRRCRGQLSAYFVQRRHGDAGSRPACARSVAAIVPGA